MYVVKKIAMAGMLACFGLTGLTGCADTFEGFKAQGRYDVVECTTDCVDVFLMPGKVTGLDYECNLGDDTGRGKTDSFGKASCPNNTTIRYFLRTTDDNPTEREIQLGSYEIKVPVELSGAVTNNNSLKTIFISPFDLELPGTDETDAQDKVLAFLLALDVNKLAVTNNNINSINAQIPEKSATLNPDAAFATLVRDIVKAGDADFEDEVNNWLGVLGYIPVILDNTTAQAMEEKMKKALLAGVYAAEPSSAGFEQFSSYGQNGNSRSLLQIMQIQNRDGAGIGLGVGWENSSVTLLEILSYRTSPARDPNKFWYNNPAGVVSTANDNALLTGVGWTGLTAGTMLQYVAGKLSLLQAVYGNAQAYQVANGSPNTSTDPGNATLGRWNGAIGTPFDIKTFNNASLTLFRPGGLLGFYFAPRVWRTDDTVLPRRAINTLPDPGRRTNKLFPMALTLTLSCADNSVGATYNCTGGKVENARAPSLVTDKTKIGIVITKEGNIVTDDNLDCIADNGTTAPNNIGAAANIGVVRDVGDNVNGERSFLVLSMLWSNPNHGELQGVEIGTTMFMGDRAASPKRATLDLTNLINSIEIAEADAGPEDVLSPPPAQYNILAGQNIDVFEFGSTVDRAIWQNLFAYNNYLRAKKSNSLVSKNGFKTDGRVSAVLTCPPSP